jgi:chitinase
MKASVISALGLAAAANAQYNQSSTVSTVYTTSVYTITSCAATVTDCPGRIGQVTTDIISLYTTICPVTETEKTYTPTAPVSTYTPWSTSTVYSTKEYTITSCPPEVTNCPIGSKTSTVITQTTSCPVTEVTSKPYTVIPPPYQTISKPYSVVPPPYSVVPPPVSYSTSKPVLSTITISTCVPSYYTTVVTVSPSGTAGGNGGYPTVAPVCPGGANCPPAKPTGTGYPVGPKNTTTPYIPVTGGASGLKVGGLMAVVGVVAALL